MIALAQHMISGVRAIVIVACAIVWQAGCCSVTVYQPLRGLQRPAIVNVAAMNFAGTRILVRCLPGKDLPAGDADKLCRNLATLFRQQGAEAEAVVPRDPQGGMSAFEGAGADFTVEVESKLEHADDYFGLAWVSVATCTLIPSIDEQTFMQSVVVRGRDRSVLATDSFRARFVNYTGIGVWSINWIMDFFFRSDDQDMSGDEPKKDFSRDFYAQVSQLAFNARVRSELLGLTKVNPTTPTDAPPALAAPPADVPPLAAPESLPLPAVPPPVSNNDNSGVLGTLPPPVAN
jgi:hypothetical protein